MHERWGKQGCFSAPGVALFSRPDAVRIRHWMRRMLKALKTGVQGAVFPAQRWSGFCVYKKRGVW